MSNLKTFHCSSHLTSLSLDHPRPNSHFLADLRLRKGNYKKNGLWDFMRLTMRLRKEYYNKTKESRQVREMILINSL